MAGMYHTEPTLVDKLAVIPIALRAILATVYRALTSGFQGNNGASTYLRDVAYAGFRSLLSSTNVSQDQWLSGSTDDTYFKFAKSKGLRPSSLVLPGGTKAHWVGSQNAKKVILYFHGGGYVLACSPAHMQWLFDMIGELNKQGKDVAALLLSYTLAPQGHFPAQMKQGVQLLRHVMEDLGKHPSDIFLAGDSAGGNLSLAILSHILHPHPAMPPLSLPSPLAGAALISPWCCFDTSLPAFTLEKCKDFVTAAVIQKWGGAFLGPSPGNEYSEPVRASAHWWKGLTSKAVKDVLIWGGRNEVLIDSIREVPKKIETSNARSTTTVITQGMGHVGMIIDTTMGIKKKTEGQAVVEYWLRARL